MTTISSNRIVKARFYEPVRNLPNYNRSAKVERKFAYQFAQAYVNGFTALHRNTNKNRIAVAREISANGYGIADLVAVCWKCLGPDKSLPATDFISKQRPTTRAFEIKISDWRRGLMQANRYRFFANASIVVLPTARVSRALSYINTFRMLGIGLWSFDVETDKITTHFTPKPRRPIDRQQQTKVLIKIAVANGINQSPPVF